MRLNGVKEKPMKKVKYPHQAKYDAANVKHYGLKLNKKTDADIIEWLDSQENKQSYLKELIRADIAKNK